MTNPETARHLEVKDEDDRTAAVAEVSTDTGPEGTVRTSIYAKNEVVRPGDRAALVDTVMELPEVQASDRLEATVVFGDAESVKRLRERTEDAVLRAAGGTTLLDANIPSAAPAPEQAVAQPRPEAPPAGA
ncbi:MAG TPA: hypothetical protein VGD91_11140 [Trebonia sp.]